MTEEVPEKLIHCSFCGKNQHEVRAICAGIEVWICLDCWLVAYSAFEPFITIEHTVRLVPKESFSPPTCSPQTEK